MDGKKKLSASQLGSAAKENMPPKKANRSITVSGLFNQTHQLRQKSGSSTRDVLAPKPTGISKPSRGPKQGLSAQYRKPKKVRGHPLYLSFAGKQVSRP